MFSVLQKIGLVKPVPRMFKRLEGLYKYSLCTDFQSDKLFEMYRGDDEFDFKFHTSLGDVHIKLSWSCYIGTSEISYFRLVYCNYAGFRFAVMADKESVSVEPYLNEYFSAQTVDLAILELEEHLRELYGDPDFMLKQKRDQDEIELRKHLDELQKLY